MQQELNAKDEELFCLKSNSAFKNLEELLANIKVLIKKVDQNNLDEGVDSSKHLWDILTMKIPKKDYLSLKLQNYKANNDKMEVILNKKKIALEKNKNDFEVTEQQRKFLESEIDSLKKIEKLKERFFEILLRSSQNEKVSYREKLLRESLKERSEGNFY